MLHELIILYHSFNRFLGTTQGEFYKQSIEAIILLIITYMVASEYGRERELRLKYLIIAFSALFIEKIFAVIILGNVLFGSLGSNILSGQLQIILSTLEIIALLLIAHAFTYTARKEKQVFFQSMRIEITAILLIFVSFLIIWNVNVHFLHETINLYFIFVIHEIMKIIVLGYAFYLTLFRMNKHEKYRFSVLLAFAIYLLTPILTLINLVFLPSGVIRVLSHPFPIIAILLFMRATYLKLVDKATLKEEITTTRTKYQQELELSKLKDEFVSTVSHELKTPLTSMRLHLSLLEKQGDVSPKQQDTIALVQKENRRLTMLINDLLDLSKLENKKITLKLTRTNLNALVQDTLYNNIAEEKKITLTNNIPEEIMVALDEDRFKQVIINLYSNAIKFTPSGGDISFSAKQHKTFWEFMIKDNGIGIPKDKQKLLFTKFFQVENYLTRQQGGTGLGLAIVKHIIDLHHGKISISSVVGKGTTVTIRIPVKVR
jgi:signal transduction histidine kinase